MKKLFTLSVLCSILLIACSKEKKDDVVQPLSSESSLAIKPVQSAFSDSTGNTTPLPIKKKVVKIKYPKPRKIKQE